MINHAHNFKLFLSRGERCPRFPKNALKVCIPEVFMSTVAQVSSYSIVATNILYIVNKQIKE